VTGAAQQTCRTSAVSCIELCAAVPSHVATGDVDVTPVATWKAGLPRHQPL
jgi:hypothetical protein